ncbi:MAG TPA: NADH-quinone oxidoreductase subunit C [Nitrospiria bacterium]|jgi:NADH/F420H2 dehydrogenase subunit C|nr:NADH-quinone oxidoreductase subunit C [Nitrospiria bacterium]
MTQEITQKIQEKFPREFVGTNEFRNEWTVTVKPDRIVEIARFLRDDPSTEFDHLSDIYSVDNSVRSSASGGSGEERFEVVYLLNSIPKRHRLRLKTLLREDRCEIDSVYTVWRAAGFLEREVYDLMGIRFRNHPDLRRIFLPEDFDGHPLRKEYPAEGKGWRNTFEFLPTEEPQT